MKRLFSLLGSLAAGAAIGLLFAPNSGKETREKIKSLISEKMPDLSAEKLEQLVDEVLSKFSNQTTQEEEVETNEAETEEQEAEEE